MGHMYFQTVTSKRNLMAILILGFGWPVLVTSYVLAQGTTFITPTTGVGNLDTKVTPAGDTIKITGGTRPNNGSNLFHSFDEFSVGRGETAQFLNTTPSIRTDNILSRVTGGNPSSIFGAIDSTSYPKANLFLMNPAGIIFGPSATLNVGGSVTFTTADYLRLANTDGLIAGIFHAHTSLPNILSSSPVTAFGFLGSNPAAIAVQGSKLIVDPNQSISLVGGNHSFTFTDPDTRLPVSVPKAVAITGGHLKAPGGQIKIASVASPGEILAENFLKAANINAQSFGALGTVQIARLSHIETSGESGGRVLVRGGRLLVDDSTVSANTKASKSGAGRRLDPSWLGIGIEVEMAQDAIIDNGSLIETNVEAGAAHKSGGVHITADHITISGGPKVLDFVKLNPEADTPFAGVRSNVERSSAVTSGDISLNATSSIHIKDFGQIETSASPGSSGHLGSILINSSHGNVNLTGNSKISSFADENSTGNTGSIKIEAPRGDIVLVKSDLFNSANGTGTLKATRIKAHNLHLLDFSSLGGDNLGFSLQDPENVTIILDGTLRLDGGSFINTGAFGSVASADLIIQSPETLIAGKTSFGFNSGLYTSTISSGNGGRLHLGTDNLQLRDGGLLSSRSFIGFEKKIPSGHGGEINIEGYRNLEASVVIDGPGSGIFTNAEGTGAAGDISVKASTFTLQNSGTVSAETTGPSSIATGGSINVAAKDHVTLTNSASITAGTSGPGNAGNILLKANDIAVNGGSSITASSTGSGNAGTVTIQGLQSTAHSFLVDGGNSGVFTKTSNTGTGGNLSISSNSILIQNNGTISGETTGVGSGGNITLTADESVTIKNGATISSSSTGSGPAGNVEIHAGKQFDVERGSVTTQSNELSGGNITILASDLVRVVDGKISTSALNGGGNGGNITIDPKVVLLQSSEILAQAKDGNGGSISIATPLYLKDQSSLVSADSQFGVNGTVTIQSPISNVSGTVGQLVSKTSPPQVLLQNRCIALAGGEQSTFLLTGRDTLPGEPSGWLSSPTSMEHWTGEETAHASRLMVQNREVNASPNMATEKNKPLALSLRRLTPPGFLVRTFATGSTGCPS